jgi:hypothetical protein
MNESRLLDPVEAEAVIEERIDQYGAGALPVVEVRSTDEGKWRVRWGHVECTVAPMTLANWMDWVVENVGPLDADGLETTEA